MPVNYVFALSHPQRDLAGVAGMLRDDPEDMPKTIVFCRTKNDCAKVYNFLSKSARRHAVGMYHANLTQGTKAYVQEQFRCRSQLKCLSATVAFGMVNNAYFLYRVKLSPKINLGDGHP